MPAEKLEAVHEALAHDDPKEMIDTDGLLAENSPYEEVRVAVRNTDGGEIANTVRAWILGMLFVTIGSGLNMFLSMRYVLPLAPAQSCRSPARTSLVLTHDLQESSD